MFSRLTVWTLLVSVLVWSAGGSAPARAQSGTLTGYVVDQKTNGGIGGASVTSGSASATTDSSGYYKLSNVPPSARSVSASASLYKSGSVSIFRNSGSAPRITLAPNYGAIQGTVKDATTGKTLTGATIVVGGTTLTTTTNASGAYTFSKAPGGSQTLTASLTSYASASATTTVTVGRITTLNFALTATPTNPGTGNSAGIMWNGVSNYLLGVNYPWWNYGTDFGTGGWGKYTDWSQISANFATMNMQNVRVVRWFVFADGRYAPEFNTNGTVSGLDSQFFTDIDAALQLAHDNNVYLLPCLVDFLMFGSPQSSGSVTGGGHSALGTDAATQQSYLDNALKPLLQHVAASPYKNYVIGYDIVNEPEWEISETAGGPVTLGQAQTFVKNCATYIHQYGGGAYATLGSATPWWVANWKGVGLDFYQFHYYSNYDSHYGGAAGAALVPYSSLGLDKPCIVGEFATNDNSYTIGDNTPLSAQWHLDTIYKNGYAGALGWSFLTVDGVGNWPSFQPVYANWTQQHSSIIGPK